MRTNRMGLAAAIMAAQLAGAMVATAPTRRTEEDDEPVVRLGVGVKPREPVTTNRDASDLEAIRAAEMRRARKVARQAKGFRQ